MAAVLPGMSLFAVYISEIPFDFVDLWFQNGILADFYSEDHDSSIFRLAIQPCMWFLLDGTG